MKTHIFRLPFFAALCAALLSLPTQAARLALVVGNDAYQVFRPLRNAAQDARDVAAELRGAGFEVPAKWVVTNATRRQMDAAVQDFVARIGPQDEVVFYFSGHGVEIDAQAALVPVDLSDPSVRPLDNSLRPLSEVDQAKQQVLNESVTLNRIAADIAAKNVKFSLLIVDACRDNPVLDLLKAAHAANPNKAAGPPPKVGLIADSAADSQVLLFSASKGQQSLDRLGNSDPKRNGVFTRVLLEAMKTPGLGLRDMLPKIKAEVKTLAASVQTNGKPHQQEPRSMASYDAPNFYFRPPAPVAPPVQVASIRPEPVVQPAPPVVVPPPAAPSARACAECPELVVIPGGSFEMGSNDGDADEKPIHRVNIKSFELGKYEVTQGQWKAVMGSNPSKFTECGDTCPVEKVSWDDIQEYIKKLNAKSGQKYRLPSEAEWEYAARAGTKTKYSWGDGIGKNNANCDGCGSQWDNKTTAPVGQFKANGYGLHDMHGNVREWVQDCWHGDYKGAPSDGSAWTNSCSDKDRVLRGGSWYGIPASLRSADRSRYTPDVRVDVSGFRLARTLLTP